MTAPERPELDVAEVRLWRLNTLYGPMFFQTFDGAEWYRATHELSTRWSGPMPDACPELDVADVARDLRRQVASLRHAAPEQIQAVTLRLDEAEVILAVLELLPSFVDDDPCWFDHHGGCQAHGYLSLEPGQRCPQAELKALLGRLAARESEEEDRVPIP